MNLNIKKMTEAPKQAVSIAWLALGISLIALAIAMKSGLK